MSRAATVAAIVALGTAGACDPWSGGPVDLTATVPFDADQARGKVALAAPGAEPPRPQPGTVCAGVAAAGPRIVERMKEERPPEAVLDALDRCYETLGRAPELVALYQEALRVRPAEEAADLGARLAGAFVTLGDRSEALRRLDVALAARADHAPSLFLKGLVHASGAADDPERTDMRAARDAWRRLLEVAPDHEGLGAVKPHQIRERVERWTEGLGEAGAPTPVAPGPAEEGP